MLASCLGAGVLDLGSGGVDRGDAHAIARGHVHREAAEAAADVDDLVAGLQAQLARHVVQLVALRFLERAHPFAPVCAGVEHQLVEPQPVEVRCMGVVELGVLAGAKQVGVGVEELVPAVAQLHQRARVVEAALHAGREALRHAALDVDVAVEVGLEQPDMAVCGGAPVGAGMAEDEGELGVLVAAAVLPAAGKTRGERNAGPAADLAKLVLDERRHGGRFSCGGRRDATLLP
jgi:hypothetical protein